MMKTTIKFDANALKRELFDNLAENQTQRLIAYAKSTCEKIGNRILQYNRANHLDRTGNLLNSLCWSVAFNNENKGYGFFREPVLRNKGIEGTSSSFLHEKDANYEAFEVDGRALAQSYIDKWGKYTYNGWRMFIAILAPYWGYWEEGFTMKNRYGAETFTRFQVMTQIYDQIVQDLRPANTKIKVYVDTYSHDYPITFKNGKTSWQKGSLSKRHDRWDWKLDHRKRI